MIICSRPLKASKALMMLSNEMNVSSIVLELKSLESYSLNSRYSVLELKNKTFCRAYY